MSAELPHPTAAIQETVQIALVGNPNTGKSTLFNRLTGSRQRVGNFPGVTVSRKTGEFTVEGQTVSVTDLPGTYSLAASSIDERIAVDFLTGRAGLKPNLAVCMIDTNQLQRSLFIACQVADLGVPLVIALNFMDEAKAKGLEVETATLSDRFGVPVVPICARSGAGIDQLVEAIHSSLTNPRTLDLPEWPSAVEESSRLLREELAGFSNHSLAECELRRTLFDGNSAFLDLVGMPIARRPGVLEAVRKPIRDTGKHPLAFESLHYYQFLETALRGIVHEKSRLVPLATARIDSILTHRALGLLIFAGLMFLIFQSIYSFATPLMDGIEGSFGWLSELCSGALASTPVFQSLVCDGIIAGVGGVIVFLPQIFILFFFISLLEDTGYMARAAFLMDKLFGWCGLNGKSFVPLLSSYACAIPGLYATRTIEDPKARLVTILIAPLMSCSARLPVYLLMIGAFVAPIYGSTVAAATLFFFQVIGLAVALPLAWLVNRIILRMPAQPFVMEMPPYRLPVVRDVLWRMWLGGRDFLQRAGSIILIFSIFIWALLYFPRPAEEAETPEAQAAQVEKSYLGTAGRFLEPIFEPAGFDWKITVGVLASFPAREVIVATLGIIYSLGDSAEDEQSLQQALREAKWTSGPKAGQPVFTLATALAIMVFFAFCMQCASTLAVVAREASPRYAVIMFVYMTALAYFGAIITYQLVTAFGA